MRLASGRRDWRLSIGWSAVDHRKVFRKTSSCGNVAGRMEWRGSGSWKERRPAHIAIHLQDDLLAFKVRKQLLAKAHNGFAVRVLPGRTCFCQLQVAMWTRHRIRGLPALSNFSTAYRPPREEGTSANPEIITASLQVWVRARYWAWRIYLAAEAASRLPAHNLLEQLWLAGWA